MKKNKATESFCHSILQLEVGKSKALANLVMGLSSKPDARSVTAVSTSRCYHYQYSSIADAINALYEGGQYPEEEKQQARSELEQKLLSLKSGYMAKPFDNKFYLLNTDSSSLIRPHSPTLPGRTHVYTANNRVKGNRPVDIGYSISVVGLAARRPLYGAAEPAWDLPLSIRRLGIDSQGHTFAARQIQDLLDNEQLPFGGHLTVNASDRYYGSPEYIAPLYEQPNFVNAIRLTNNRAVWKALSPQEREQRRAGNSDQRGANAVYGEKYKLSQVEQWALPSDEETTFGVALSNGRRVLVQMQGWGNMMVRSKRGMNMKDKPLRLVSVRLLDPQTKEPIFKRRMWLGVWGQRAAELTLEEVYWAYRQRFDIEHFLRFGKQNLLMDSFQTPDVEHLDNWMEIVSLAYWLLWAAKDEAQAKVYKWQKYDKRYKKRVEHGLPVSPSEVQRQMEFIILSFEQEPFLPKLQIKSRGRKEGHAQGKRARHKVVWKRKKAKKKRA